MESESAASEPKTGDERRKRPPLRVRARSFVHRHPTSTVILIAAVIIAIAVAVLLWIYFTSYEHTDDAEIDAHIAPVSARISGDVSAVLVEDNQTVRAGQALVLLDVSDNQVAYSRAQAELARAEAQLEQTRPEVPIATASTETSVSTASDEVSSARADLAASEREAQAARARLAQAEANEIRAKSDIERYRYLVSQNAVPRQQYDAALAAARAASAEVRSNRALAKAAKQVVAQKEQRLDSALARHGEATHNAPKQVDVRRASLDAAQAAVRIAEAGLARARLDLSYTRIDAPVAGIIGQRNVEPGEHVAPGQSLLAVVDTGDVWVTANFKETQLRHIRPGLRASVVVDAWHDHLKGHVESIGGATGARFSLLPPENATGNFVKVVQRVPVRIRLDPNQPGLERLRPGLSVEVKVYRK